MKRKLAILCIALSAVFFTKGQNIPFSNGGGNNGVGNSSSAVSQLWSINNNQAGLAYLQQAEIGIYYTNRFLLKALSSQSLAYALPTRFGTWGVAIDYFGYAQHSEWQIGFAYAKKINNYIALGTKFNYLQYQQTEIYGSTYAVLASLGILSHPADNLYIGAYIYNPTMAKFNTPIPQTAPTIMSIGIAYLIDDLIQLTAQIDKNLNYTTSYKAGAEMRLNKLIFLRTGVNLSPNAFFIGLGYNYKNIRFNLAFSYQQLLGISPASSLEYQFLPSP